MVRWLSIPVLQPPKVTIKVGEQPMLVHVADHYLRFGSPRFLMCSGSGHEQVVKEAEHAVQRSAREGISINMMFTGDSARMAWRLREALGQLPNDGTIADSYGAIVSESTLRRSWRPTSWKREPSHCHP